MTHSSRRERRTKAIAEVLVMIDDAHPELAPDRPDSDREADEWLWDIATGFCAVGPLCRACGANEPAESLNRPAASPVVTPAARGPSVARKLDRGLLHRLGMPPFFVAQLEPLKPKKRYLAFAGPVPSLPANNPKS